MRNYLATYNLLAVSAKVKEGALNTEQILDTSLLVADNTILSLVPRREDNQNELTGKEEADTVYDLGATAESSPEFDKAQAQHFAFGYAYALGNSAPGAAYGTGYKHVITPTSDMFLPSFTSGQRYGKTIMKRLFASMHVDQLTAKFERDNWATLSLTLKGTGKHTTNMLKETVQAAFNAVSISLAENGVEGTTPAARLDNVHAVRVLVPETGEWMDVAFSVVSDATPAVITITAPGEAVTETTYEILYMPTEPTWCTFPSRVTEPPLRVSDLVVMVGGKWNGSAFLGGHAISSEIESIEHTVSNNMAIEFRPGGTGSYANYAMRQRRAQTLKLNRQFRDYILQRKIEANEYFGVKMTATGAEFEPGKRYFVDVVFPRCNVLSAPLSVNNNIIGEAGDLIVLEDDTYGSVRVEVANKVSGYAQ